MASPNVSFDQIPSSVRKPGKYLEFNTKTAVRTLPINPQRLLIIGQMLVTGQSEPLVVQNIFSDQQAAVLFGYGSHAHLMARAAIESNHYLRLEMIGLHDAEEGIAAVGTLTANGTAISSGVLSVFIGNTRIDVAVRAGDTVAEMNANILRVLNQRAELPVLATADAEVIKLTAKHKGSIGNEITLSTSSTAQGVTLSATNLSGGQVDPDIEEALTAVFNGGHNIIVCPWSNQTALTSLRDHLDITGGPMEQRGAVGVAGFNQSLAKATTLAGSINHGRITMGWHNGSVKTNGEIAAAYAAIIAFEEDPARPLNTLAMPPLDVTPIDARPGRMEQETALANGVTPFEIGPGDKVQIVRAISTYVKNAEGVEDPALLDITTIRTLDYVRKACRERISLRFPREKLSSRTAVKVRSELLDVLIKLEELEIVEEVLANKSFLIVERDSQDPNRMNAAIPCDVVNGLHVFAGRIDLLL